MDGLSQQIEELSYVCYNIESLIDKLSKKAEDIESAVEESLDELEAIKGHGEIV